MKFLKKSVRLIASSLTALIILTVWCSFYSNKSTHIPNKNHNTDYVWRPNYAWIGMTEGIAWGRMDAEGYNNPKVVPNPDILILGSSHMEAVNVLQKDNTAGVLQKNFGDRYQVYNKGISGHFFEKVCQYLEENLSLYEKAPKYVIIETDTMQITQEDVDHIFGHTVEFTPSRTRGFVAGLQKNPFLRHCFHQLTEGWLKLLFPKGAAHSGDSQNTVLKHSSVDPTPYDRLFSYMETLQEQYNTQIIIFNHPAGSLQKDGSYQFDIPKETSVFADSCRKHHILFADMQEPFRILYEKEHKLPHGFTTGRAGIGHLNADGHRVIADTLYRVILNAEEEEELCQ